MQDSIDKGKLYFINGLFLTEDGIEIHANSVSVAENIALYLRNATVLRYDWLEDYRTPRPPQLPKFTVEQEADVIKLISIDRHDLTAALSILLKKSFMNEAKFKELQAELNKLQITTDSASAASSPHTR